MSSETISRQTLSEAFVYDDGHLRIEYDNYYVSCQDKRMKLSKTEFLVLSRLSQTPNRIVTYEELWKFVWEDTKPLNIESLKVYIYNLRRLFEPFGIHFETMVSIGYRFAPFANDSSQRLN